MTWVSEPPERARGAVYETREEAEAAAGLFGEVRELVEARP